MQEGPVGVGAFALKIMQEPAAQLAGFRDAGDGRVAHGLPFEQGQAPVDPHADPAAVEVGVAFGQRVLEHHEGVAGHDRRAGDPARHFGARNCRGQQGHIGQGFILLEGGQGHAFAQVWLARTLFQAPVDAQATVRVGKHGPNALARCLVREAGRGRIGG